MSQTGLNQAELPHTAWFSECTMVESKKSVQNLSCYRVDTILHQQHKVTVFSTSFADFAHDIGAMSRCHKIFSVTAFEHLEITTQYACH